jgi:zinc transport system ATP-binding protein
MNKKLIVLRGVCFSYEGKKTVLEDVSLDIKESEIVGIAGPNGAGKTTLLKLIVGLLKPNSGRIEIVKNDGKGNQLISYLPQNSQRVDRIFPATVREVVSMGLYGKVGILGRLGKEDKIDIENAIKNVGLEKIADSQITSISGGQLQRTLIARSLVSKPSLLILDEPTAAVDLAGEEEFYMLIKHLNQAYGVAVLLVSHDVYSLLDHTSRLIFINKKVLYDGEPMKLSSSKLLSLLFSHEHSKALVKRLEKEVKKLNG